MAIEKLKEIFNIMKTDYEIISEKEIAIPCPADYSNKILLPQKEIIENHATSIISDECWVHILEDDYGELSWLVVVEE